MARQKNLIRSVEKKINIPEDLYAEVELQLFSTLEGKVPYGAWQQYFITLAREDLNRRKGNKHDTQTTK